MGEVQNTSHKAPCGAGLSHCPLHEAAPLASIPNVWVVSDVWHCPTVQGLGGSCFGPGVFGGPRARCVFGAPWLCQCRDSLVAADTQCSLSFTRIEEELGSKARFAGRNFRNPRVN